MKLSLGFRQSFRLPSDSFTPKEPDRDLLRSLEPPPGLVICHSQASLFRETVGGSGNLSSWTWH